MDHFPRSTERSDAFETRRAKFSSMAHCPLFHASHGFVPLGPVIQTLSCLLSSSAKFPASGKREIKEHKHSPMPGSVWSSVPKATSSQAPPHSSSPLCLPACLLAREEKARRTLAPAFLSPWGGAQRAGEVTGSEPQQHQLYSDSCKPQSCSEQ